MLPLELPLRLPFKLLLPLLTSKLLLPLLPVNLYPTSAFSKRATSLDPLCNNDHAKL